MKRDRFRDFHHVRRLPLFREPPAPILSPAQKKFRKGDKVRMTFKALQAGHPHQEGVVTMIESRGGGANSVNVSVNGKKGQPWHMAYWEVFERDGKPVRRVTQRATNLMRAVTEGEVK